jgi:hypothetical protein
MKTERKKKWIPISHTLISSDISSTLITISANATIKATQKKELE